jgi:hypothetical protein
MQPFSHFTMISSNQYASNRAVEQAPPIQMPLANHIASRIVDGPHLSLRQSSAALKTNITTHRPKQAEIPRCILENAEG